MAPAPALVAEGGDELVDDRLRRVQQLQHEPSNTDRSTGSNTSSRRGATSTSVRTPSASTRGSSAIPRVGRAYVGLVHRVGSAAGACFRGTASGRPAARTGGYSRASGTATAQPRATRTFANSSQIRPRSVPRSGGTPTGTDRTASSTPGSPIIVDTGRDGYELTSLDNGVRFDLNADGVPELDRLDAPELGRRVPRDGSQRERRDRQRRRAVRQSLAGLRGIDRRWPP